MMRPTLLVMVVLLAGVRGQEEGEAGVKLGDFLANLVNPDRELIGGFSRVFDRANNFDGAHLACGTRGICHATSLATVVRRDGSTVVEAGILRQAIDGVGNALFDLARPLLEVIGLGAVAREELSFTDFIINMVDSAIVSVTRVLAGRRVSRQFEEFSPVLAAIEPVATIARAIPKAYVGNIVDFVVDLTNVADRDRGLYSLVRAGTLGYTLGGDPDDPVCNRLDADLDSSCDDGEGNFYPLASLNQVNDNKLGKLLRPGEGNPLMKRNHIGTDVMNYNSFELSDLFNPKSLLCKTSNLLGSMQKHVDVAGPEGEGEPEYYEMDAVDIEFAEADDVEAYDYTATDRVKDIEDDDSTKMAMKVYNRVKAMEDDEQRMVDKNRRQFKRPETDQDHFDMYCQKQNMEAKRAWMKKKQEEANEAIVTETEYETEYEEETDNDVEEEGDYDGGVVEVKRNSKEEAKMPQINDLEQLARLGDRSLLVEKLEVEEGAEKADMEQFVTSLNVTANGKVEKVVIVEGKKKMLLVQFDTVGFRDAVLRASRSPEARSISKARLRKPKVKDLKHVESLRH